MQVTLGAWFLTLNKMSKERNMRNECWSCIHKRTVPGDRHISCAKPDLEMKGNPHGIKNEWFLYPIVFDPVWKIRNCNNYETK